MVQTQKSFQEEPENKTSLISKNITVSGRRTSVRLEPEMWKSLEEIAKRERCSIHDICTLIYRCKKDNSSLTASIRVFLMLYYRSASTEQGHNQAGHGNFQNMKSRADKIIARRKSLENTANQVDLYPVINKKPVGSKNTASNKFAYNKSQQSQSDTRVAY